MTTKFITKEVKNKMKKALMIVLALLISVAFVTTVFAQAKPAEKPAAAAEKPAAAAEKPAAAAEKPAKAADKPAAEKPAKVKVQKFAGDVAKVEGTMVSVKTKKAEKTFDVSAAKFEGYKDATEVKAGDKVLVTYTEADGKAMAKTFKKAGAAKATKKVEPAKAEPAKPAAEPAKPAEPAKK